MTAAVADAAGLPCSVVRKIACPRPLKCPTGQMPVVHPGDCCPTCQVDCSRVSCVLPVCPAGQVLRVPEGECCPVCQCEIEGQVFQKCRACSATCIQILEYGTPICGGLCEEGCGCPANKPVIDSINRVCVTPEECPRE